ncbi:Calcitonin gene-related peptide type 1 receptor [Armadillidium nasatum]|uniref:Calcitonin gene-related peptide type 1 receptor n=1 Tax=Armadillidium nasatum TaxID=96803 RepID=A0A5N5TJD8_9CRUS|nr:Calcitonin gene-related peptide type 1 receptor [Armadillidium nasatum]
MESVDKGNKSRSSEEESVEDSGSLNIPKEVLQKAQEECETLHANMSEPDFATDPYCPRLFDGWSCWNDTPAGEVRLCRLYTQAHI